MATLAGEAENVSCVEMAGNDEAEGLIIKGQKAFCSGAVGHLGEFWLTWMAGLRLSISGR
jgi:hypothetical protein